jgi:hypothetical protein
MNDVIEQNPVQRLALAVGRLLDAEVLTAEQSEVLSSELDASCRLIEAGRGALALDHVRRLEALVDGYVATGVISAREAREVHSGARELMSALARGSDSQVSS